MQLSLVESAYNDIFQFLKSNDELMFNERDLQMHLAMYLKGLEVSGKPKYDDVDLEYYVPYKELKNYIWESELRLDIVIRKGDEFLPVELKYKTKTSKSSISRFNEFSENIDVLKNQGAQDLGCYDLWKDVRRIELVRQRYKDVKSGLAVFVSNDVFYWDGHIRDDSAYREFSLSKGLHGKTKKWSKHVKIESCRPSFEVERQYEIKWEDAVYGNIPFRFFIIKI